MRAIDFGAFLWRGQPFDQYVLCIRGPTSKHAGVEPQATLDVVDAALNFGARTNAPWKDECSGSAQGCLR